jgi:hypothetical protein
MGADAWASTSRDVSSAAPAARCGAVQSVMAARIASLASEFDG